MLNFGQALKAADPEKGKFRSFLLLALKRFMANEWDKAQRLKRGGGREVISLDEVQTESRYLAEPTDTFSPEKAFERTSSPPTSWWPIMMEWRCRR